MPNTWETTGRNMFVPHIYTYPKCTTCQRHDKDIWSYLLFMCKNNFIKQIPRCKYYVATHQLATYSNHAPIQDTTHSSTQTQQVIHHKTTPYRHVSSIACVHNTKRTCLTQLRPNILCIQGDAITHTRLSIPTPNRTIQLIEFTITDHDVYSDQAIKMGKKSP